MTDFERVRHRIEGHVLAFCSKNRRFLMNELTDFVQNQVAGVAPDSPAHILRALRQRGIINYEVLSRSGSLYAVRFVQSQGVLF